MDFTPIKCPHCGAEGKTIMPPDSMTVLATCSACKELMALFMGRPIALDKQIINAGSFDQKINHVFERLSELLWDRVQQMFGGQAGRNQPPGTNVPIPRSPTSMTPMAPHHPGAKVGPITDEEFASFKGDELRLIDQADYFRAIFG